MAPSIVCTSISAFICLFVPSTIAIIMIIKRKGSWIMFVLGIATFTVSQLLLRTPLIELLYNTTWFNEFSNAYFILYMILTAFSAGLFEESGRYAAMRFLKKDLLTWENGILFGLGHGGIEAFLVGLRCFLYIADMLSGKNITGNSSYPPIYYNIAGIMRVFAVTVHIGLTLIVVYAVKHKKLWCFLLAILLHTVMDIALFILPNTGELLNVSISGGLFALFAATSIIFSMRIKPVLKVTLQ